MRWFIENVRFRFLKRRPIDRTMRLPRYTLELICLAALMVGAAAGSLFTALNATHDRLGGDAWRRTANGWEYNRGWQSPRLPAVTERSTVIDVSTSPVYRLDSHPAALALVQLVAVLLALRFFPRRKSASASLWNQLPALISRSYRASFFGC